MAASKPFLGAVASLAIGAGVVAMVAPASAQSGFFAGRNLTVVVGTQVGGSADTLTRTFTPYLKKHLAGSPNVIVQNMTGGGSNIVFNFLGERADKDGFTIAYSTYQGLAQALGDTSLRTRFENLEYIGGVSDTRVNYMRTDAVPGGAKAPKDLMKAPQLIVAAYSNSDVAGMLSQLSLRALGVKHKLVVGYRGGAEIFLAMQRNEVQFHNTGLGTFRTRSGPFVKSGEMMGAYHLASSEAAEKAITDMPSFPKLYAEVHGKPPSGAEWDALSWLSGQTGELAYAAFAPKGTPEAALAALRVGFARAAADPDYIAETTKLNGAPHEFVSHEKGAAIIRSLATVSPAVVKTIQDVIEGK